MATYRQLCRKAIELGHPLTPELRGELKMLADIPDADFCRRARKVFVKDMADKFKVPVAVAEIRLEGVGPFLTPEADQ